MMQVGAIPQKESCSDWALQLEPMKLESQVIVDQHATVNLYPSLGHLARHIKKVCQVLKLFALASKALIAS